MNKYLHLISIKERGEVVGLGKERPGKIPASDNLVLSFPLCKMGPLITICSQRAVTVSSIF